VRKNDRLSGWYDESIVLEVEMRLIFITFTNKLHLQSRACNSLEPPWIDGWLSSIGDPFSRQIRQCTAYFRQPQNRLSNMRVREYIEMAHALSFDKLKAVAESVKCPVHQRPAVVTVAYEGFAFDDVCCDRLRPLVQSALLEYKLVVQRKFIQNSLR